MDPTIELLLKQLEKTNQNVRECQNKLTISLIVVCVAIVLIIFIIFKGKGYFSKDKVIIGAVEDKDDLHKLITELKKENAEIKTLIGELRKSKKHINK